jgi:hypothetical protein
MYFITGLSINTINQAILGRKVGRHQRGNQKLYRRRQHNDQKKRDKRTNNNLQKTTQKTKDPATQNPLKPGGVGWG